MKILGILGSPRNNGNTALLLDAALDAAAGAGAETEKIGVAGLDLGFCIACGKCYGTGECIYDDGVTMLQSKMKEADGIILASPNYIRTVTAQLKTLMDRSSLHVHCFLFSGKYGASVVTAGGNAGTEIAEFANEYLQACGAQTVGVVGAQGAGVGALVDQEAALARAAALGEDLAAAIREKRQYPDQAAAHAAFAERMKQLVQMMAEHAPFQLEHWQNQGWL
jgi:multimeric flavodoxin WrbA